MRTIAIINQKGGCGKTTTAINLAGVFARRGGRTLLVDMDPQSHCAAGLAIPEQRIDLDIGDAMVLANPDRLDPARLLWRISRNLDLAPSRMKLAGLEAARGGLADRQDRDQRLAQVLKRLAPSYDVCLIDCAPSIGLLTYNAIVASDAVLIPVETSFFSLQGATKQVGTVRSISRRFGLRIPHWLVPTLHEPASPLSKDLLDELRRRFGRKVVPLAIRRDAALKEASSFGQPVFDYAPTSPGAADYTRLADWLAGALRLNLPEGPSTVFENELHHESSLDNDPLHDDADDEPPTVEVVAPSVAEHALAQRIGSRQTSIAPDLAPPATAPRTPEPSAMTSDVATETPPLSRAEDMARRALALHRRIQGAAAPVVLDTPSEDLSNRLERSGGVDSVRHLFGARQTSQGMLFVQPVAIGQRVAIAGEFNQWSPTSHIMRRNDDLSVFELTIPLAPGRYAYRLVVDGMWTHDQYNPQIEPNPFGERNSFVIVR
ncbi:MAG: AAA family ATPase [Phycisphaeraceae bacterium]|nr:AAA family ATPase [Phycisphaeraceae bacterium]MCW5753829.1 AAA family ATPase [Phycisphaeraceae bacterium]